MTKSCAQINGEVALHLEWKRYDDLTLSQEWLNPKTKRWQEHPPDFCGKWEHAGPLFEKLVSAYGLEVAWERIIDEFKNMLVTLPGKSQLRKAITRAFHAAFVEEGAENAR